MKDINKLFLVLILIIFMGGCTFTEKIPKSKPYYSQFKNTDLAYDWDFSMLPKRECGYTYNSSYFELRNYSLDEGKLIIPYEICYKHEEGHIYQLQLLDVNNFDDFISYKFKLLNRTDTQSFRYYMIHVSEGISNYYAINYFNDSKSRKYLRYLESENDKDIRVKQHYLGLKYVEHSLNTNSYKNFTDIIMDLGSEKQYLSYLNYLGVDKLEN